MNMLAKVELVERKKRMIASTAQKMMFFIKDLFSKYDQI